MADGQDSEWFFAGSDGFSLVLPFGLVWEPYGGRCTEANFLAVQNLHVFTVPLQCPYSALTVPLCKTHSSLTTLGTGKGGGDDPYPDPDMVRELCVLHKGTVRAL